MTDQDYRLMPKRHAGSLIMGGTHGCESGCEGGRNFEGLRPRRSDTMRRWEGGGLDPVGTRDHARGPIDAPVTLVKYGDYECPYCGEAHPVLMELQERVGEQVRFVFRHFPSTRCILVPAVPLRPQRRPLLRTASGRCMTSST